MLEQAAEVLLFVETFGWHLDINTILAQPAELFHATLRLKVAGEKLKKQKRKNDSHL